MLGSVFLQHRAVAVVLDSGRPTRQPARVLSLAPGRFRRPAALALAREGRSRSSLLRLLLFGLLGLTVAALFAFGHRLSPLRVRSRISWIFSPSSNYRADDRSRPSRGRSAYAGADRSPLHFGRRGPADSGLSRPPRANSRPERPRGDPRVPPVACAAPPGPLRPRIAAVEGRLPSGPPSHGVRRGWWGSQPWPGLS